jgi:hypothetical protein
MKFLQLQWKANVQSVLEAQRLEEKVVRSQLEECNLSGYLEAWRLIIHSPNNGSTDFEPGPDSKAVEVNSGRGGHRVSHATMLKERRTSNEYWANYHMPAALWRWKFQKKNIPDFIAELVQEVHTHTHDTHTHASLPLTHTHAHPPSPFAPQFRNVVGDQFPSVHEQNSFFNIIIQRHGNTLGVWAGKEREVAHTTMIAVRDGRNKPDKYNTTNIASPEGTAPPVRDACSSEKRF